MEFNLKRFFLWFILDCGTHHKDNLKLLILGMSLQELIEGQICFIFKLRMKKIITDFTFCSHMNGKSFVQYLHLWKFYQEACGTLLFTMKFKVDQIKSLKIMLYLAGFLDLLEEQMLLKDFQEHSPFFMNRKELQKDFLTT